jgi:hypothetical protein
MTCIRFYFIFHVNEIILFQILYKHQEFLFFFTYESTNNKMYPTWAMLYQWPEIPKKSFFEFVNIAIRHLIFAVTFIHFIYISILRVFVVKILG